MNNLELLSLLLIARQFKQSRVFQASSLHLLYMLCHNVIVMGRHSEHSSNFAKSNVCAHIRWVLVLVRGQDECQHQTNFIHFTNYNLKQHLYSDSSGTRKVPIGTILCQPPSLIETELFASIFKSSPMAWFALISYCQVPNNQSIAKPSCRRDLYVEHLFSFPKTMQVSLSKK